MSAWTWEKFKKAVEESGIKDNDRIELIEFDDSEEDLDCRRTKNGYAIFNE